MRVSIIIPSFNYGHFLAWCIDSALGQTHADTEVVVVDDCSTDGSQDIIRSFGSRVVPVIKPVNGGHASSFNAGLAASTGQFVMFLDADDYLYPNAASEMLGAWRPGVSMVQGLLDLVDSAGQRTGLHPASRSMLDEGSLAPKLLLHGRIGATVTSGLAFPRAVLEQVMPIPEQAFAQGADGYLASVCPFLGDVSVCGAVVGAYRRHHANHSQFGGQLSARARWQIMHDQHRYAAIRARAGALGLTPAKNPGGADLQHLGARVASLKLEPGLHPIPGDSFSRLLGEAMAATRTTPLPWARRWATRLWFLGTAWLPGQAARTVIEWSLMPSLRPAGVMRWGRRIKRVLKPRPLAQNLAHHSMHQSSTPQL